MIGSGLVMKEVFQQMAVLGRWLTIPVLVTIRPDLLLVRALRTEVVDGDV